MTKLILIIITLSMITSCISTKKNIVNDNIIINENETFKNEYTLKNDINTSIIDGFYDNDTTGISKTIYIL